MRTLNLADPHGVRYIPESPSGAGVLTLAGSSGRVDADRARRLADLGVIAESIQWFGGPGQNPGPWDIPLEVFFDRLDSLAGECGRVVVLGTSFGAEAALLIGSLDSRVDAVVAFAPTDVVWAGVRSDGTQTAHWTLEGEPLPFVPLVENWEPATYPPAFYEWHEASYAAAGARARDATIETERIPDVVLIAGGDDQVWPSITAADRIRRRRESQGRPTTVTTLATAGHCIVLPGEERPTVGHVMARGGTPESDSELGRLAWRDVTQLLVRTQQPDDTV